MKISLIRHGRPAADLRSRIACRQFEHWLHVYEQAGVDRSLTPSPSLIESLSACALMITSPAARAIQSADMLGLAAAREIWADAAEAPLPTSIFLPVALRPGTIAVLARVLWLLGAARATESKKDVCCRAEKLATVLSSRAATSGHVVLVAHGYLIRFLRRALASSGWRCSESRRFGYWSYSHFERAEFGRSSNLAPAAGRNHNPIPHPRNAR